MGRNLNVEVGQDPQQGRADIDAVPLRETEQSFEAGKGREIRHGRRLLESQVRHLAGTLKRVH